MRFMAPKETNNRPLTCPECGSISPPVLLDEDTKPYLECLSCGWTMDWAYFVL